MKKTKLYQKTTEDIADTRTQEKRRRSVFIIIVIIATLLGLIWKGGPFPVYFILGAITALILWYNKPWGEISCDDVAETEVSYFLSIQLKLDEEEIQNLNKKVSDLYHNLPPDPHEFIKGKVRILMLNERIISLHKEIILINETLEEENNPLYLQDFQRVKEEVELIKCFQKTSN